MVSKQGRGQGSLAERLLQGQQYILLLHVTTPEHRENNINKLI